MNLKISPWLLCALRWRRMDVVGLCFSRQFAEEAKTDAGRSWGYTLRDGCRRSRESGLSCGLVRTDLQAAVHLCLASRAGLYNTHTDRLSLTDRGVRVSHVHLTLSVLPALQSCLLSLWQQGSRSAACPLWSGLLSSQNHWPDPKHFICLSKL